MTLYCKCGGITDVLDSRPARLGSSPAIRRRRRCRVCSERITTLEGLVDALQGTSHAYELARNVERLKTIISSLNALRKVSRKP